MKSNLTPSDSSKSNGAAPDPASLYAPQWVSRTDLPKNAFDEILPGLFMGGTDDDNTVNWHGEFPEGYDNHTFDAVATLYAHAMPMGWGVEEMRLGIYDSRLEPQFIDKVVRLARWSYERWQSGDRVLIRCQAGMNRSGLVTALTLMFEGYSAVEAITLIRNKRANVCLMNNDYVDWLITQASSYVSGSRSPSAA